MRVPSVQRQQQWVEYCLRQRACGALLVATPERKTIHKLARLHRGVQFVVVNTALYELEDSRGRVFTGTKPEGAAAAAVLHLFQWRRKGGAVSTVSYNGAFTLHHMDKFVSAHLLTKSEAGELLIQKKELPKLISKRRKYKQNKEKPKQQQKKGVCMTESVRACV